MVPAEDLSQKEMGRNSADARQAANFLPLNSVFLNSPANRISTSDAK
jgi:hypothetical protein